MRYSPLLTDLYQLTMLAGYLEEGMAEEPAVFDLFFRTNPFQGGYAVFAGLETALDFLENLRFAEDELEYLQGLRIFRPSFIDFLRTFRFRGKVTAMPEGTVVFANEPLVTVEAPLAQAQIVETALLTILNFQTLVATKAARIVYAAAGGTVLEFGLRRSQGPDGGVSASRAAYVGGVRSTSNVLAGKLFGIPVKGTHAHSWIMAFPDELTAFRAYAEVFPDSSILLVDTYDTLKSGIPNAITVARELRDRGHELVGVRIDSGDLAYLSRETRRMFDEAGYPDVKIVASNELDEHVIESMRSEGGCVDIYGVGTRLATGAGEGGGALGGVYKLVRIDSQPKLKVTSDIAKATLPDRKRVLRAVSPDGSFIQDVICLIDEEIRPGDTVFDPANPIQHIDIPGEARLEDLRTVVMEDGRRTSTL
ncbi:MAG: nicotinate phosphoribosyltransferase, partial [Desulfuromonadales bacterium]